MRRERQANQELNDEGDNREQAESDRADQSNGFDTSRFPDNFYPGLLIFLDRARGTGRVRSFSGREITFQFPFVSVVGAPIGGPTPGLDLLKEGDEIGFDVGWTAKGLRVTRINPARRREN